TIHVLECVAPASLHVDRFLPPTPIRVLVDHTGNDATASLRPDIQPARSNDADAEHLLEQPELREDLFPRLLQKAGEIAAARTEAMITAARKQMNTHLAHEISRLIDLQKVNRSVRTEEIDLLREQRAALDKHLSDARIRLDAIRLIRRGPRL